MSCRKALVVWIALITLGAGTLFTQEPTNPGQVYPNLLLEVSREFASTAASRVETKSDAINSNKQNVHTTGRQTTSVRVNVGFLPSTTTGRVELLLDGVTNAQTNSQRKRIHVGNAVQMSYQARKVLIIDENGVREEPAQSQPHLDYNILRYINADVCIPAKPLVKRIAYRVYTKQKPKIEADITRDAGDLVNKTFDETTAKALEELNRKYMVDYKQPMVESKSFPQKLRIMTSEHQLGIRALLNDPTGKAMNISAVPEIHGWPDVAIRVEESLLNNFAHTRFAGKSFTGEELDDEFNRFLKPLMGDLKTIEAGEKPFEITFPKEKPIEFRFFEGKFKVTIRGEEFVADGRDYDAMDTTATYTLRKTPTGLIAERIGNLVILPPGFKPGATLGIRDKILQQLLERKFGKVFKPSFEMKEIKLPEKLQKNIVLHTTQVQSEKGWLTLGFRSVSQ